MRGKYFLSDPTCRGTITELSSEENHPNASDCLGSTMVSSVKWTRTRLSRAARFSLYVSFFSAPSLLMSARNRELSRYSCSASGSCQY